MLGLYRKVHSYIKVLAAVILFMLLTVACSPSRDGVQGGEVTPTAVSHGGEMTGLDDFVASLQAADDRVEVAGEVEQSFFPVKGRIMRVNGIDVQVFEFANEAERLAASSQISPDGSSIGTTMVTWVDTPHFWAHENLIVLYVGEDQTLIDLITRVLGSPITNT